MSTFYRLLPAEKSKCTAKEEKTILGHLTKFIKIRKFWKTIYQSLFKIKRETALATGFVKNLAFLNTSFPKKKSLSYICKTRKVYQIQNNVATTLWLLCLFKKENSLLLLCYKKGFYTLNQKLDHFNLQKCSTKANWVMVTNLDVCFKSCSRLVTSPSIN